MRILSVLLLLALAAPASARPTDVNGGDLRKFAAADVVEHYDTTRFRVFFTRAGANAVPSASADGVTPDYVKEVGALYESVLDFYLGRGFLSPLSDAGAPNNGGDERFDVYLVDFAGSADGSFVRERCSGGTCSGYMVEENDFAGYAYPSATIANRILSSHEFFHAVQAAYSADQDVVVAEGTAVWATEQFDPTLSDFEGFVGGYLSMADHSIDRPGTGPVPSFAYGMAIFFEFLSEKVGADVIRALWEDCRAGARGIDQQTWLPALVALLPRDHATTFADAFTVFATWNLFTLGRADPARGYARGAGYPLLKGTGVTLPYTDEAMRVFYASEQVLDVTVGARTSLVVDVVPAAGAAQETLAALRVVIAPLVAGKIGTLTTRAATDAATPIALGGAGEVLVALVGTATSGDSTRGILCIGDEAEAAACRAAHAPAPDMGTMPTDGGGGCSIPARRPPPIGCFVFLALALLGVRRRAR